MDTRRPTVGSLGYNGTLFVDAVLAKMPVTRARSGQERVMVKSVRHCFREPSGKATVSEGSVSAVEQCGLMKDRDLQRPTGVFPCRSLTGGPWTTATPLTTVSRPPAEHDLTPTSWHFGGHG